VISDEPILYPYTTRPDVLVVLSQEAYTRFVGEMNPGGILLVEQDLVRLSTLPPSTRVYGIPATRLAEEKLGKKIVLNVVMVGFFAAKTGLLSGEAYRGAIADSVPAAARELNLRAFELGYEFGMKTNGERAQEPVPLEAVLQD